MDRVQSFQDISWVYNFKRRVEGWGGEGESAAGRLSVTNRSLNVPCRCISQLQYSKG